MATKIRLGVILCPDPIIFEADYDGAPIKVKLDNSARWKLLDLGGRSPAASLEAPHLSVVEAAAERVFELQRRDYPVEVITISALDLD